MLASYLRLRTVAALYVATDGIYYNRFDVDPWDEARDARTYAGPWPVVAHPPCERWGRYWSGGPNPRARRHELGSDSGCFASALACVRTFGGVLEHPEASHAFRVFGLGIPSRKRRWFRALDGLGWICCVEQGNYGHKARKATWLYYVGNCAPFELIWHKATNCTRIDEGFNSKREADTARKDPAFKPVKRLSAHDRIATPLLFAEVLLALARGSI
jgi:hypothetical protein